MATRTIIDFSGEMHVPRTERHRHLVLAAHGTFLKSAIMTAATRRARRYSVTGLSWARRTAIALRVVWADAKRSVTLTVAGV